MHLINDHLQWLMVHILHMMMMNEKLDMAIQMQIQIVDQMLRMEMVIWCQMSDLSGQMIIGSFDDINCVNAVNGGTMGLLNVMNDINGLIANNGLVAGAWWFVITKF